MTYGDFPWHARQLPAVMSKLSIFVTQNGKRLPFIMLSVSSSALGWWLWVSFHQWHSVHKDMGGLSTEEKGKRLVGNGDTCESSHLYVADTVFIFIPWTKGYPTAKPNVKGRRYPGPI